VREHGPKNRFLLPPSVFPSSHGAMEETSEGMKKEEDSSAEPHEAQTTCKLCCFLEDTGTTKIRGMRQKDRRPECFGCGQGDVVRKGIRGNGGF